MAGDSHLHRLAYGRCVRSAERSGKRRTSDMPETKNERNAREARFWEAQKAMCQNLPTTDKTLPDLLQYVLKHASQDPMLQERSPWDKEKRSGGSAGCVIS